MVLVHVARLSAVTDVQEELRLVEWVTLGLKR